MQGMTSPDESRPNAAPRARLARAVRLLRVLPVAIVGLPACGSTTTDPEPEVLRVAGTYTTAVSLTENSCGSGITVSPNPTVVTHTAGASTLGLAHGPLNYSGTVTSAAAFTTQPNVVQNGGVQSTLNIVGQFTLTGFTATVTVDVVQSVAPTTCRYKVAWVGTKQGAANTIP